MFHCKSVLISFLQSGAHGEGNNLEEEDQFGLQFVKSICLVSLVLSRSWFQLVFS